MVQLGYARTANVFVWCSQTTSIQ